MAGFGRIAFLIRITRSHGILRRYFVVNGFDGALTMLGIVTGFLVSDDAALRVVISACLGAAIALAMSGLSSAYISERAERRRALGELEAAMVADLGDSAHGWAARWVPALIAAVNGLAPLLLSLVIMIPLGLAQLGVPLPLPPLVAAMITALVVIFLLGVFLGQVGRVFWLLSGLQALGVALATVTIVLLLGG
jgi:predicted membrane protein (TIGR00267 family)